MFTSKDQTKATAEGWAIFESNHGLQIQRIDFPDDREEAVFQDDEAAVEHVKSRAAAGCETAINAIQKIVLANPEEAKIWSLVEFLNDNVFISSISAPGSPWRLNDEGKPIRHSYSQELRDLGVIVGDYLGSPNNEPWYGNCVIKSEALIEKLERLGFDLEVTLMAFMTKDTMISKIESHYRGCGDVFSLEDHNGSTFHRDSDWAKEARLAIAAGMASADLIELFNYSTAIEMRDAISELDEAKGKRANELILTKEEPEPALELMLKQLQDESPAEEPGLSLSPGM